MVTKGVSEKVQVSRKTEIHTHVVGKLLNIIFKKICFFFSAGLIKISFLVDNREFSQ